jgi:hypothetical protein
MSADCCCCFLDAANADSINLVDACISFPCKNVGGNGNGTDVAICTDRVGVAPNSTAGRTCRCQRANYFYKSDTEGCTEISKFDSRASFTTARLQRASRGLLLEKYHRCIAPSAVCSLASMLTNVG